MMLRRFLPVGQGAFYLEQFETSRGIQNVIYDCGSLTDVKRVEQEIDKNLANTKEIEIVFISHVDKDHVNGLEYLLKNYNVKKIVFPYTHKKDKIDLILEYFCDNENPSEDDFTYKFINDPYRTIRNINPEVNLIEIREFNDNERSNEEDNFGHEGIDTIPSGTNVSEIQLYSQTNNTINTIKWDYIPFNFRESDRKRQFYDELEKNLGHSLDELNLYNFFHHWNNKKIQKAIIDAYRKVKGSLNTNSMVVFSGIKDNNVIQRCQNPYIKCFTYCPSCFNKNCFKCVVKKNGCLYTGDYDANGKYKWNDLKKAFSDYWDYIGCVQIPHHGSYRNYNSEFALLDAFFVISAGAKNKYRHPNGSVLKDLLSKNHYPFIVTEQQNSEVMLAINI